MKNKIVISIHLHCRNAEVGSHVMIQKPEWISSPHMSTRVLVRVVPYFFWWSWGLITTHTRTHTYTQKIMIRDCLHCAVVNHTKQTPHTHTHIYTPHSKHTTHTHTHTRQVACTADHRTSDNRISNPDHMFRIGSDSNSQKDVTSTLVMLTNYTRQFCQLSQEIERLKVSENGRRGWKERNQGHAVNASFFSEV